MILVVDNPILAINFKLIEIDYTDLVAGWYGILEIHLLPLIFNNNLLLSRWEGTLRQLNSLRILTTFLY